MRLPVGYFFCWVWRVMHKGNRAFHVLLSIFSPFVFTMHASLGCIAGCSFFRIWSREYSLPICVLYIESLLFFMMQPVALTTASLRSHRRIHPRGLMRCVFKEDSASAMYIYSRMRTVCFTFIFLPCRIRRKKRMTSFPTGTLYLHGYSEKI